LAPSLSAARASSTDPTETPMMNDGGERERAAATGRSYWPRWTPSAPAARAMSNLSLTMNLARDAWTREAISRARA